MLGLRLIILRKLNMTDRYKFNYIDIQCKFNISKTEIRKMANDNPEYTTITPSNYRKYTIEFMEYLNINHRGRRYDK